MGGRRIMKLVLMFREIKWRMGFMGSLRPGIDSMGRTVSYAIEKYEKYRLHFPERHICSARIQSDTILLFKN